MDDMAWDPKLHPRYPPGTPKPPGAGTFMPKGGAHWAAAVSAAMGSVTPSAGKSTPRAKPKRVVPAAPAAHVVSAPVVKTSTDAQLDQRARRVDRALNSGVDTYSTHHRGGRWSDARAALHQTIVDEMWQAAASVPNDHKAIMAGGPVGAGKSTVLGARTNDYLMLAADDAKEALARHDAIPAIPGHPDLSPMERSGLTHEESIHIVEMLAQRAYKHGKNVIWDGTMGNVSRVTPRIAELRRHGYGVEGVFVGVDLATSTARAQARYRTDQRAYEQGKGHGGRVTPSWAIAGTQSAKSNFRSVRRLLDSWTEYDNSGAAPVLKAKG